MLGRSSRRRPSSRARSTQLIRTVSGRSAEETVTAVEELARRGLLAESGSRRARVPPRAGAPRRLRPDERGPAATPARPRRRGARRARHRGDPPQHFRFAGRDAEAAAAYRRAGEQAPRLYANAEALAAFREALALGGDDPSSLHEAIGDLETLAGEYSRGSRQLRDCRGARPRPERLGAIEHRIGLLHARRGEWELAESSFEDALEHRSSTRARGTHRRRPEPQRTPPPPRRRRARVRAGGVSPRGAGRRLPCARAGAQHPRCPRIGPQ